MTAPVLRESRTYGGWRAPASPGLGSLTLLPTALLFLGILLAVGVLLTAGIGPGLLTALLFVLAIAPLVIRVADRPAWREVLVRWAWRRSQRSGAALYRSGPLGQARDAGYRLPGLLARSRVWTAQDDLARLFALIEHPFPRHWTAILAVNPTGGSLISTDERDVRVAGWDRWLANLGREPGIVHVAVVLDQMPDPGRVLQACVERAIVPGAPSFAADVMRESARVFPTGQPEVHGFVAITFGGRQMGISGSRADPEVAASRAAVEIGTRLPGLSRALVATGSGEGRPVTASGLAATVRGWYDPAIQPSLAEAAARRQDPGISWDEAGPVAAQETWSTYRHDSGLSCTFEMTAPPRGTVFDTVLMPLIAPRAGVERKRVTLMWEPVPADVAPGALDLQVRAALNRAGRRKGVVHAHDSAEVRAAMQAAREEATGAGVTNFSMVVTVTVNGDSATPERDLSRATELITRAGRAAQISLRPVNGMQAAAFAVGLGVGLVPAHHSVIPIGLRNNI